MLSPRISAALAFTLASLSFLAASAAQPVPLDAASRRAFGGIQPAISPDGEWIAVSYQGAIARLPARGGPLVMLTDKEGWDVQPVWSPDGARIAYISGSNVSFGQVRLIRSDDGAPLPLPIEVRAQGRMWFHRDGRRLLGRFAAGGLPQQVAWFDLGTRKLQPVAGLPNSYAFRLRGVFALSADSRSIVFVEHTDKEGRQQGEDGPEAGLWVLPAEGGTPREVTRFPARIYDLCWDAAGRGLYLVTDLGTSHNDVWHVPLGDPERGAKALTTNLADDDMPSAAADRPVLVYSDNSDGTTALVRHDTATGNRTTVPLDRIDFRAPTGTLHLKLSDPSRAGAAVARVSLKRKGGKFHAPVGRQYHLAGGLGFFYCREAAALALPAGEYEVICFRGPEYRMHRSAFTLEADRQVDVDVRLERWVNAAATGWYSGENHIHANYGYGQWYNTPRSILDFCEGEDLRVANLVVANSDGEAVFDREFFRGRPDPRSTPDTIVYWNQEFRATLWGHMTLMELKRLVEPIFTGFRGTTNPWDVPTNAEIARRVHAQQGTVSYTHPAATNDLYNHAYSAKGLPIDAALGHIDTIDVVGKSYEPSVQFWYRLLNCGIRIPAAAGTDCFLNRIPITLPGAARAYVHLPEGMSYQRWVAGMKAGRSFVSNGPMIELTANGLRLGDTLSLPAPGVVRIAGRAWSQFPLEKLELIHNGNIVATGRLADDRRSAVIEQDVQLAEGGWVALRTSGRSQPYWPGSSLVAHTNPIYVEIRDRPFASAADATFFLGWIDRLERDLQQRGRMDTEAQSVQQQLEAARKYYRNLAGGK